MRKLINLFVIAAVSLFVFAQTFKAQEKNEDVFTRTLEVELEKSDYLVLEPVQVKFKCVLPSTDSVPNLSRDSIIKVSFKGKDKEFRGLTSILTQGEPQQLPVSSKETLDALELLSPTPKFYDYEKAEIIDRVGEIFPQQGNYKIQFMLYKVTSNKIDVTIKEPTGINKQAFDFLSKYKNPMSFYWVWEEKNGVSLLEEFVNKYGESVYSDYAVQYLANIFLARGELDKAQREYGKIQFSNIKPIADAARSSLADIERRKADSQKQEQP